MRRKLTILSILVIIIFLSAAVIGIFKQEKVLKAGILTKGRILYKSSGMKKADEKKQGDQGTALQDATEGKVLVHFEFWDANGKRYVGSYYPVEPANVVQGVSYGANGTELTGTYSGDIFKYLRTGQITSYRSRDDAHFKKGYTGGYTNADSSWDGNTRFMTNSAGNVVTDRLTGLMWTRNANQLGSVTWNAAVDGAVACSVGGYSDWHLPNLKELLSLIDYENSSSALPTGHPFQNAGNTCWTSTTFAPNTSNAWHVHLNVGDVNLDLKGNLRYVWYCRLGQ